MEEINLYEALKIHNGCDEKRMMKAEIRMSRKYFWLTNLLKWNNNVYKECYLTAFSLNPCQETYDKILQIGLSTGELNTCRYHKPILPDIPTTICDKCGLLINKQKPEDMGALLAITGQPLVDAQTYNPLFVPSTVLDSDWNNIPNELIADITTIISSPRVKTLSWSMDWETLKLNCHHLLHVDNKLELLRQQYPRANASLQYVKLDTRDFHHLPEQEYPGGVELGYEDDEDTEGEENDENRLESDPDFKSEKKKPEKPIKKKKIYTEVKSEVLVSKGPKPIDENRAEPEKKKSAKKKFTEVKSESITNGEPVQYNLSPEEMQKLIAKRGRKLGSKNGTGRKRISTRKPGERRGRKPKDLILPIVPVEIETETTYADFNYAQFDTSLLEPRTSTNYDQRLPGIDTILQPNTYYMPKVTAIDGEFFFCILILCLEATKGDFL